MNRKVAEIGVKPMAQPNIGIGQAQVSVWLGLVALVVLPVVPYAADPVGRSLAERHCAVCHLLPDPGDLSRGIWQRKVLPDMGARLGIIEFRGQTYLEEPTGEAIPPRLSPSDWAKIHDYYVESAPATLPSSIVEVAPDLDLFEIDQPPDWSGELKGTTSLLIDEAAQRVILGDAANGRLVVYSSALEEVSSISLASPPVHISKFDTDTYVVTLIGSIVPSEDRQGAVVYVRLRDGDAGTEIVTLLQALPRPVQSVVRDFDSDGRQDILVAGFGHLTGELALYRQQVPGAFSRQTLFDEPGAIAVRLVPNGRNGITVYVLFAQGNERILRISETGDVETVLRFQPSNGSSALEVVDFDGDGDHDLLYVSGDNAGLSPELKPYHGVYLFRDTGGGRYEQVLFFPMNGAYGVRAEDFDGDGDRDIAAIAFFGDYRADPDAAGFVFLENQGGMRFRPRTIGGIGALGRFITMEAGDLDGDGDIDLVLGSFASVASKGVKIPDSLASRWATAPPFVVLRNKLSDR